MNAGQFRSVAAWNEALGTLANWLKEDARQRKSAPGHAPTPTLRAIYSVLVEAMDHALLPVIIGSYGIGKSYAAEVLVEERPRTPSQPGAVLVELRSEDNTVPKCIETVLRRLRHDSRGEGGYAALCRVLRPGDLLILDEATSALDTESERAIQSALDELQKNRTSLVIAHRLSTIEQADEIVVVEDGIIVERGSHADLLEHRGVYAQLHKMQFGE